MFLLAKHFLAPGCTLDCAIQRKIRGRWKKRKEEGIALVISNEDMNVITIIKLFENSVVLIDGVSQRAKHEIKKS